MFFQAPNSSLWLSSESYRAVSLTNTWSTSRSKSPDEALLPALETLQAQSSDQIRNDALAAAAINNMVTGTIGSGLRPLPAIDYDLLGSSEEEAHAFSRKAERLFAFWAQSKACDFSQSLTFWEMENLVFRSSLEFGDTFVVRRDREAGLLGLCLQTVEASRVGTPLELQGQSVLAGIEVDPTTGQEVAYYVQTANLIQTFCRVLARNDGRTQVLHLAHRKRVGQTRGVPFLATVTTLLKQLARFTEGETAAAALNSFIAFVTRTKDGSNPMHHGVVGVREPKRILPQKITPHMNVHLMDGESIEMLDPKRPNSNFGEFVTAILKMVGAELEIPYEVLLSSFNSSYSASRAAMVKAFQVYKLRRKWLIANFHQPVWEWFIEDCVERKLLVAKNFDDPLRRFAYTACEWVGDSSLQLDPLKEAAGAEKLYDLGVVSKKALAHHLTGQNYENVVEQRRKEAHA